MVQWLMMAGVIQAGVLTAFLLRTYRGVQHANRLLAGYTFVLLFYLLIPELVRNPPHPLATHLIAVSFPLLYLLGPLLFGYVVRLTKVNQPMQRFVLHFIPAGITLLYFLPLYFSPLSDKVALLARLRAQGMTWDFALFWNAACAHIIFYLVVCWRQLKKYNASLEDHYSKTDTLNLRWLQDFARANALVWTVYFVCYVLVILKVDIDPLGWADKIFGLTLTGLIYYLSYVAMHKPELFPGPVIKSCSLDRSSNRLADEKLQAHEQSLMTYMRDSRPYLDPELSLSSLSLQTGIPARTLSFIINENHHQNFFDFINTYRIKEVKERLHNRQNDHLTIVAIALESGFNSKSTFNEVFKRLEKTTPSEFKKRRVIN